MTSRVYSRNESLVQQLTKQQIPVELTISTKEEHHRTALLGAEKPQLLIIKALKITN